MVACEGTMDYRREIDGLRAIAVVPVVLFHAGFNVFSGGFVGVDVFFVISGYLITSIILGDLERCRFSLAGFYERRARRILPALFLVVLVCFPIAWLCLLPDDMQDFSQSLVAVSLFASNILFCSEAGYFDSAGELKPLLHTWSLAVEEQYYLIFPVFMVLIWKIGRGWLLWSMAAIAAASLWLAQWGIQSQPAAAFYLLPSRAFELLIGALAAVYLGKADRVRPRPIISQAGAIFGLLLVLGAMRFFDQQTPFPGVNALIPVVGTVLIILLADKNTVVGRILGAKVLVGIGLVSYSAYLWHHPLFAFARHVSVVEPGAVVFCLLAAVSFALAYLSWRVVETPFRCKERFSRRQIASYGLVGSACILCIGLAGHFSGGFIDRFETKLEGDVGHLEFYSHIDARYHDCEPASIASEALSWNHYLRCKQSRQGQPQVILLGDSHAEHLFIGLAEKWTDLNVVYYIQGGAPYVSNPQFQTIFDEILNNETPQTVILTMHYVTKLSDSDTLYREFSETVDRLQAAHKKVILVGDIPRYQVQPFTCKLSTFNKACYMSRAESDLQRSIYHSALQKLGRAKGVPFVDLYAPLCNQRSCSMVHGNAVVYRDRNHLNVLGSRLIGDYLASQLSN